MLLKETALHRFNCLLSTILCFSLSHFTAAYAEVPEFATGELIQPMRSFIGKALQEQTIEFSNKTAFVLEALTPEGSRLFFGGNPKKPGENADELRLNHQLSIIVTPCPGAHDLSAKISAVSSWETLDGRVKVSESPHLGLGIEQLLAMMNTPSGIVTPSTLRSPRVSSLRGPVFEYVRGDTTETLSFVNEGPILRINWNITNSAVCPR